jgi:hypothetical protein
MEQNMREHTCDKSCLLDAMGLTLGNTLHACCIAAHAERCGQETLPAHNQRTQCYREKNVRHAIN